jgi:hypothetical protein
MSKPVVFTFGRMNPPTAGHEKLINKVYEIARTVGGDARVYLSHTKDRKKNPLDYRTKLGFAQIAFGSVIKRSGRKTIIDILKKINEDTDEVYMIVGSDRVEEFRRLLNNYNNREYKFKSIRILSAGDRDPDAEGVSGLSASKMRALAKANDFDKFHKGLPKGLAGHDNVKGKQLFNKLKKLLEDYEVEENIDDIIIEDKDFYISDEILQDMYDNMQEEDYDEVNEVLSLQARKKRARTMKRLAPRMAKKREMKKKRMATGENLEKRARKAALKIVRTRVAGKVGANYVNLSVSQKMAI